MTEMQVISQTIGRSIEPEKRSGPFGRYDLFSKSKLSLLFCSGLAALYLGLFLYYDKLQFPMIWDENHFGRTTLLFSKSLVPDFQLLTNYSELNTPLPFIIFGALARQFKDGLFAGRFLNLVVSLIITCTIGLPLGRKDGRSILAAAGLLCVPYYLWLSTHLYTDILSAFFVLAGFWLYVRNKHALSVIPFVLAIACRQFMVAFPLAIAAHEFISFLRRTLNNGSLKRAKGLPRIYAPWIAPSMAALTLLGWFWLFHGVAPSSGIAANRTPTVQRETWGIAVDSSLYFLACVGFYFVIPEWVLFSRRVDRKALFTPLNAGIALVLCALFVPFAPSITQGLLTKAARILPADFLGTALFYGLALLTCIRFSRFNLATWLVLCSSGLMLKAYAWDKYVLPLLVVFWYLKSIDLLDTKPGDEAANQECSGFASSEISRTGA